MSLRQLWRRYGAYLAPLACAMAALLALLWVRGVTDGQSAADDGDAAGYEGIELSDTTEAMAADILDLFEDEEAAEQVSGEEFLDELERLSDERLAQGVTGPVAVTWDADGDIVNVASDVVQAYAELGGATLATSGYLDLQGNVWGAVVRGGTSWVDIVLVSTNDDEVSTASIVRLLPESYEEDG